MSTTVYVVTEIGFEYNDEIYSSGEVGGGSPTIAYRSKVSALNAVNALTLEKLKTEDLNMYSYSFDELFSDWQAVVAVIAKYNLELSQNLIDENYYDDNGDQLMEVISRMTDADINVVVSNLDLAFYEVTEIELEG